MPRESRHPATGSARSRRVTLLALTLAVMTSLALLAAGPAGAHSYTRRTNPEADSAVDTMPRRVAIWFNEPVDITFGQIRVFDRADERVDQGEPFRLRERSDTVAVALRDDLRRGRYRVEWQVVSADSHPRSGTFEFRIPRRVVRQARQSERGSDASADAGDSTRAGPDDEDDDTGRQDGDTERTGDQDVDRDDDAMAGMAPTGGDGDVARPAHGSGLAAAGLAATRGFTMAALLLVVGVFAFWLLAWRGLRQGLAARPPEVESIFARQSRRVAIGAAVVAVLSTCCGVVFHGAVAADISVAQATNPAVLEAVLGTPFGHAAVGRILLLEMLAVLVAAWRAARAPGTQLAPSRAVGAASLQPPISATRAGVVTGVLLVLLATLSVTGHAVSSHPVALHVGADVLHLLFAGAWIGGLVMLLGGAFVAARRLSGPDRVQVLGPVVERFSRLAAVSVAVIAVTGVFRAWSEVGSLAGLTSSGYGRVLIGKVTIFAVLLGLGAVNHFWARRRIRAAVQSYATTGALAVLRRSVTTETVLAAAVVTLTAVLVQLPPPTM